MTGYLKCRISRGSSSGDRVVIIRLANGREYTLLVCVSLLRDKNGKYLKLDYLDYPGIDKRVDGRVQAIVHPSEVPSCRYRIVEVPDGQWLMVTKNELVQQGEHEDGKE